MPRTAKIYARLQSQRTRSARHVRYLLDGHGTESGTDVKFWCKGIAKLQATIDNLPKFWAEIDRRWKHEKNIGGTVAKQSKVMYMQALIALPNSITASERHSLSKQILRLLPQRHPVTIVAHEYGPSELPNKHLHIAFSYRKNGYGGVNREFQQGFEKKLKALLKKQYRKYGFVIEENKEEYKVKHKPQNLMRVLLRKHGRDRMRNPHFLSAVVLRELREEVERCKKKLSENNSEANMTNLIAAEKSVAWLSQEISKAETLKQPTKASKQPDGIDFTALENPVTQSVFAVPSRKVGR